MKKILILYFCFIFNLISAFAQTNYMYVDSLKGLRVRNSPNLNGEIIYSLQNKTQVEVLQTNDEKTNINGVLGNWTLIKTRNIQGWVFG
ncbi:MAG: SH3 domain-containing protein [Treponema sp.]|nr:SH3 domain-containing protein [Treponema sp.]